MSSVNFSLIQTLLHIRGEETVRERIKSFSQFLFLISINSFLLIFINFFSSSFFSISFPFILKFINFSSSLFLSILLKLYIGGRNGEEKDQKFQSISFSYFYQFLLLLIFTNSSSSLFFIFLFLFFLFLSVLLILSVLSVPSSLYFY